jgi:sigma-B regulation protein RsbU (phosphoserine phosphatase)
MDTTQPSEEKYDKLIYCLNSLADMGETISGVGSIERSAREILHIVLGTLGSSKGALLMRDGTRLIVTAARGLPTGGSQAVAPQLLGTLERVEETLLPRWLPAFPEGLKEFCDRHFPDVQTVVAVILRAQEKLVGMLLLSKRFMHQEYTAEDLRVLDMIGRHVSVALYNFDLRRKIESTNFQLSRKVLQLESLHGIGLSVASLKARSEMLQEVLRGSISLIDARSAFYAPAAGDTLTVGPNIGTTEDKLASFIASPAYAKKLLAGKSINVRSSRAVKEIFGAPTLLAVPVKTSKKLYGALGVIGKESKRGGSIFNGDDRKLLEAFATQAAVALENADMQEAIIAQKLLKKELETAATLHRLTVPSPEDLPAIEGYRIYGYNYPCTEVGGDYFDVIPISEQRFGFVICDVSGKGLPAAFLVSTLQATFHSLFQSTASLTQIAERANRLLIHNTTSEKFATAFMGIIDRAEGTLETVNAGHNEPLLLRASGETERLSTGGLILGMFDFATYESKKTALHPGDTLYLYTDGISEAFSPEGAEFGVSRLEELVESQRRSSPRELLLEIERVIREWTGYRTPGESFAQDDFTQLAIQRV